MAPPNGRARREGEALLQRAHAVCPRVASLSASRASRVELKRRIVRGISSAMFSATVAPTRLFPFRDLAGVQRRCRRKRHLEIGTPSDEDLRPLRDSLAANSPLMASFTRIEIEGRGALGTRKRPGRFHFERARFSRPARCFPGRAFPQAGWWLPAL
jgi:hypothetical protein